MKILSETPEMSTSDFHAEEISQPLDFGIYDAVPPIMPPVDPESQPEASQESAGQVEGQTITLQCALDYIASNPEKDALQLWLIYNIPSFTALSDAELIQVSQLANNAGIAATWLDRTWLSTVKRTRRDLKPQQPTDTFSARIRTDLTKLGHSFALNECTQQVLVNDKVIDEGQAATIRTQMRDLGHGSMAAVDDIILADAYKSQFHPVKRYLESLTWDGADHIAALAGHLHDKHDPIEYSDGSSLAVAHVFLKKWLIGAIAKVYVRTAQNPVLTWIGKQGDGKSHFVDWLSPLPEMFVETRIEPDNVEHVRHLAGKWIWAVDELGATTDKAHRESLKGFLTKQECTYRVPFAKHAVTRPAMASFMGTVNKEGTGFLDDPTGNRRFLLVELEKIDWEYAEGIDKNQVWAQAYALFKAGERWTLTPEEIKIRDAINAEHSRIDIVDEIIGKHFKFDPKEKNWVMSVDEIVEVLKSHKLLENERSQSLYNRIAVSLQKRNVRKFRTNTQRGYEGIAYVPNHGMNKAGQVVKNESVF